MNIITVGKEGKEYIHYGAKHYDKSRVKPLTRHLTDKPSGGFWGSPVDTDWGWKEWCESEDFRECREDNSFKFRLKPGSRIWYISKPEDTDGMPLDVSYGMDYLVLTHGRGPFDFMILPSMHIDAVELSHDEDYMTMHDMFYSWDCDSILVINPNCVEEIHE